MKTRLRNVNLLLACAGIVLVVGCPDDPKNPHEPVTLELTTVRAYRKRTASARVRA